jgi:hypothetical protein
MERTDGGADLTLRTRTRVSMRKAQQRGGRVCSPGYEIQQRLRRLAAQ